MAEFLLQQFELEPRDLYRVDGPVNLVRLSEVPDRVDRPDLKYPPFQPGLPAALEKRDDMFELIRSEDILLHHPFQSFAPVIDFLRTRRRPTRRWSRSSRPCIAPAPTPS